MSRPKVLVTRNENLHRTLSILMLSTHENKRCFYELGLLFMNKPCSRKELTLICKENKKSPNQESVVQKPVNYINPGLTQIFKSNFQLLAYEVEHIFPQIFSGSIKLLFFKVLKLCCRNA